MKHGCFRCGEQDVPFTEDNFKRTCGSCGAEDSVVSSQEALDIINELYLRDIPFLLDPEEYNVD